MNHLTDEQQRFLQAYKTDFLENPNDSSPIFVYLPIILTTLAII